ncbi:E3 ubiquitin-protein ligase RNF138 [Heterocephalus glaber]|uniref:E3 ubiquitin-protein ligase RNF138 n=1 Tax=Heterocephalus glaber TaxID=10181 RepID=G5C303_HETGA|nr:E3 ubiquitin-protein ligase RNF138 [Heterocephalus glaber]
METARPAPPARPGPGASGPVEFADPAGRVRAARCHGRAAGGGSVIPVPHEPQGVGAGPPPPPRPLPPPRPPPSPCSPPLAMAEELSAATSYTEDDFYCPVCKEVLKTPVRTAACQHVSESGFPAASGPRGPRRLRQARPCRGDPGAFVFASNPVKAEVSGVTPRGTGARRPAPL